MAGAMVTMRGIVKRFPGVTANDHIDFDAFPGEIHALLGENGSGKSTLMSVLCGLYRPDEGTVSIDGVLRRFGSPREAIACGIGMVHQHFKLVEPFTVAENIMMAAREASFTLKTRELKERIRALGNRYGLAVDPEARIWQMSVGEKQRVEILRLLYHGAKIIILDEPTAVLTPQETKELFKNLKKMAADGCAVVFITHKLREVQELADRVTVMRAGRVTGHMDGSCLDAGELVRLMVGRDLTHHAVRRMDAGETEVLRLHNVSALNDMQRPGLRNLSLTVREGEILGLAGVAGNGQRELAEVITGLRRIQSGKIEVCGADVTQASPAEIIRLGVSYVPEDRLGTGLVPELDVMDNLLLKKYQQPEFSGRFLMRRSAVEAFAKRLVDKYQVKLASLKQPVKLLSGGNLQKLLLAREISEAPKAMVVVYPARGLDVGATQAVHELLLDLKRQGTAILLISEELDELMELADRIGVLSCGRIAGEFPAVGVDIEQVGMLMTGHCKEEEEAANAG